MGYITEEPRFSYHSCVEDLTQSCFLAVKIQKNVQLGYILVCKGQIHAFWIIADTLEDICCKVKWEIY